MKRKLILLLTATAVSYAGFSEPRNNEEISDPYGGFFSKNENNRSSSYTLDASDFSENVGGLFSKNENDGSSSNILDASDSSEKIGGFFTSSDPVDQPGDNLNGFFSENGNNRFSNENLEESESFKEGNRSFTNSDPGNRPGGGGGIGQNSPLSDGLPVLITCCVIFVLVKIYGEKKEKSVL